MTLRTLLVFIHDGELTDSDKLVYVNHVLKGKLLESKTLQEQARYNSKEQFAGSPDLASALMDAIMGAFDAHSAMSTQALDSPEVRRGLTEVLLNHAGLYEGLREAATAAP
jgi:type I restriction enzyme R subunit